MPDPAGRSPADRVVVTGAGMVTSLGADLAATFDAMQAGRSGVTRITRFDPTGLPADIGAQIDTAGLIAEEPIDATGGSELRLLRHATQQALQVADLTAIEDRERIAVAIGGHGSTPMTPEIARIVSHTDAGGRLDGAALRADPGFTASSWTQRSPDTAPTLLAHLLDARGPVLPVVSACAAGTQAIGEGLRMIREGRADVVVAGGAEPLLSWSYYVGFAILGALSRRYPSPEGASRPFDRKRNGFVIGEGAAVMVLETLASARARGRTILGEVLGYGDSADGYRITDMHPQANGAVQAMEAAIADAGLSADDVDYVNAHGTSTPINDPTETLACKRVFGDRAYEVPISSNKSMIGHTIGAAGAVEGILTLESMRRGVMLPTINQEAKDRRCDLDYVPNEAREVEHHVSLSNSFGFGGQNACLCLGSAERIASALGMPMRVAITAAAVRTALGDDLDEIHRAKAGGIDAVGPIQGFDASGFGDVKAAQIWKEPETAEDDPALRILGPHGRLLDSVAREAHDAAGLAAFAREDVGFFVGMGMVDSPVDDLKAAALASRDGAQAMDLASFFAGAYRQIHPLWPLSMLNNVTVGQVAIDLDIRGDNAVFASDGVAGIRALLEAARSVEEGTCRAALAAGVSGRVSPASLARARMEPRQPARPPGEGGAALVLEREEDARRRGAPVLGVILGGATTFGNDEDAFRRLCAQAWQDAGKEGAPGHALVIPGGMALGDLGAGDPAAAVALEIRRWPEDERLPGESEPRHSMIWSIGARHGHGALIVEEVA